MAIAEDTCEDGERPTPASAAPVWIGQLVSKVVVSGTEKMRHGEALTCQAQVYMTSRPVQ